DRPPAASARYEEPVLCCLDGFLIEPVDAVERLDHAHVPDGAVRQHFHLERDAALNLCGQRAGRVRRLRLAQRNGWRHSAVALLTAAGSALFAWSCPRTCSGPDARAGTAAARSRRRAEYDAASLKHRRIWLDLDVEDGRWVDGHDRRRDRNGWLHMLGNLQLRWRRRRRPPSPTPARAGCVLQEYEIRVDGLRFGGNRLRLHPGQDQENHGQRTVNRYGNAEGCDLGPAGLGRHAR